MRNALTTGYRREGLRETHQDFSDALRKRGIEEVNTPWRAERETP